MQYKITFDNREDFTKKRQIVLDVCNIIMAKLVASQFIQPNKLRFILEPTIVDYMPLETVKEVISIEGATIT